MLYQQGYEVVLEKTVRAKKIYEQIIANFRSFGNRCYEDTIIRGMPEFFVRYDARFRPQDHLLTLVRALTFMISVVFVVRYAFMTLG